MGLLWNHKCVTSKEIEIEIEKLSGEKNRTAIIKQAINVLYRLQLQARGQSLAGWFWQLVPDGLVDAVPTAFCGQKASFCIDDHSKATFAIA